MKKSLTAYGPVWDGAGVRGFSKEGYWYHSLFPGGIRFEGSTFVAKTVTAQANQGNMDLRPFHYTPEDYFPDCIHVDLVQGIALNSVGLANPGIESFLTRKRWQKLQEPFFISFMTLNTPEEGYLRETEYFKNVLKRSLPHFSSRQVGLQLNVSCPNVGADMNTIVKKALAQLSILGELDMPIVVKLNLLVTPEEAARIASHPRCDGLCIANTVPFGKYYEASFWDKLFPKGSPLLARNEKYGGGGLSGKLLLPEVVKWVRRFREIDRNTHVNAGGGIMHANDVEKLLNAGANSISFATVAMVRPWRVKSIISAAHYLTGR